MKRKVLLVLAWAAVIAVCVLIFSFSGEVAESSGDQSSFLIALIEKIFGVGFTDHFIRKLAHFTEFAALGFFAAIAFSYSFRSVKMSLPAVLFGLLYAISDEVHQLFVPGRAGQVIDVCIDLAGVILGVALMLLCYAVFKRIGAKKHGK